MGKLDGKVAVITGATSGMGLAGAKLFVDEGAHVFISGRRKDAVDLAVEQIGRNVTGVQGDSSDLDDLNRLFDTVEREKGAIDVLWASAGTGEQSRLGETTEEQFDAAFWLNARGTFFTVQKEVLSGKTHHAAYFRLEIEGTVVDGMDYMLLDEDGRIAEVTIWWRPLPTGVQMQSHLARLLGMPSWKLLTDGEIRASS
ncbi:SDR family NAD(P)-dependent oxidoreductase [Mycolicibacterium novocastrense]|uniref:SDR family NAD(P)-dependent oxidoreductase n=1 Tax=Mycolicibacterium novocastrense TaxID=59813 RepID=UPI000A4EC9D5|nr:SDR family NAD(P)-dependent oxidoreductase [Mycolicibacterium novocastrense]